MTSSLIAGQVKELPSSPGVYIMKDAAGSILYVGKAANLRSRVRYYFGESQKLSPKLQRLVERVRDLDYLVTGSEQEALILEYNLIKRHHPHYNVRLRDDKTFPYLKISLNEEWPRVYFTRRVESDDGRYFGPFASARSVRETLKALKRIFPFRSCTRPITGADPRACLEYNMNQCIAPCIGAASKQEYAHVIKEVVLFLEGKQDTILRRQQHRMRQAAEALNFERAAAIRDQIRAIEQVIEGQKIAARVRGDQDAIAFATDGDQACAQVFLVRSSRLIGRESFVLQGTRAEEPGQIMSSFVKQYYGSATYVPPLLLLQHPVEDQAVIQDWLQSRKGGNVRIHVPRRGNRRQLMNIAIENAEHCLQQLRVRQTMSPSALNEALAEIKDRLSLPRLPARLECYDISNIQGRQAVGSMVIFEQGMPRPSHYRRFRIKTVAQADDYAMLGEVLKRRFKRIGTEASSSDTWAIMPDLVLIDGGRGQLNAALAAMEEAGAGAVPVASIAKEKEEIFVPRVDEPLILRRSSPGLQLLQRARDEAHRFALGYHLRLRQKEGFASLLDSVPSIGPRRKRELLRRFGSVQAIRDASVEDLMATPGISRSAAQQVKSFL